MKFDFKHFLSFIAYFLFVCGISVFIVITYTSNYTFDIIILSLFLLSAVSSFLYNFYDFDKEKIDNKIVKNDEQLVDELLEKLMNYCYDKGINASFIQTEQGIELVSVNDETGAYTSITNLSVPKFGVLNKDNMDSYLSEMKLAIDTALSNNNK